MKKINILYILAVFIILVSCQDYYDDGGVHSTDPLDISSFEFVKQDITKYDTVISILEKTGLDKTIATEEVTFFLPSNKAVTSMLNKVNAFVKDKKDSLGYQKDTVLMEDIPVDTWKNYMARYIIKGKHLRNDIPKGEIDKANDNIIVGGKSIATYLNYNMFFYLAYTSWENVQEAGPKIIYFGDIKDPNDAKDDNVLKVITSNIQTTNGVVHILSNSHQFGFNNYDKFIEAK